jgi:uncharacterized tellurite resistance protein B-like protein
MKELQDKEKKAILWVLQGIMNADNKIHEKEMEYYKELKETFGIPEEIAERASIQDVFDMLGTINELEPEQKEYVAKLMGNMIVVDQDINYNEVKLYNDICQYCDIHESFDVDEYPDYSLSGSFPEE